MKEEYFIRSIKMSGRYNNSAGHLENPTMSSHINNKPASDPIPPDNISNSLAGLPDPNPDARPMDQDTMLTAPLSPRQRIETALTIGHSEPNATGIPSTEDAFMASDHMTALSE